MDPYKILGIAKDATSDEVHRAYLDQSVRCHPDKGGDAWRFKQILEAYEHLKGKATESNSGDSRKSPDAEKPNEQAQAEPPVQDSAKASSRRTDSRRKRKSPVAEFAKIVVGGIAGLSIAVLLLWYVFGMDVLGVMQTGDDAIALDPDLSADEPAPKALGEQPTPELRPPPDPPPQNTTGPDVAVEELFRDVVRKLQGTWELRYNNKNKHTKVIRADVREVGFEDVPDKIGQLRQINGDILVVFPKVTQRLTLVGDKLFFVEQFNPKSTYPNGVAAAIGICKRIDGDDVDDSKAKIPTALDLLSLVELPRDNLRGRWKKQHGGLVSPNSAPEQTDRAQRARPAVVIPYELPTNYHLRMTV